MQTRSAAKAIIRRKTDGRYLLLTSSEWEENPRRSHNPDLPGGLVEDGETVEEGLIREVAEEVGFDISSQTLTLAHGSTWVEEEQGRSTTVLFYFVEVQDPEVKLSWEHEKFEWVTAEELLNLEIRDPYPALFQHYERIGLLT